MFFRKRMYPIAMQATFPGVNGVNTIVIGHAELTADKTSTRWVLTVLHEHFHQLVYSQPGYYADVEKLGLAHGDKTGMWMLNYPFPYDSARGGVFGRHRCDLQWRPRSVGISRPSDGIAPRSSDRDA